MDLSLHFNDNPRVRIRTSALLGGGSHEQLRSINITNFSIGNIYDTNWFCDSTFG